MYILTRTNNKNSIGIFFPATRLYYFNHKNNMNTIMHRIKLLWDSIFNILQFSNNTRYTLNCALTRAKYNNI